MSSHETDFNLCPEHGRILLDTASVSIDYGLRTGGSLEVVLDEYPGELRGFRATFVTLRIDEQLRGCMGALKAVDPLILDVSRNAFSAAFCDPRFSKLTRPEFEKLDLSISILGPSEPIWAGSQSELLDVIRPGIDGLIVHEGKRRGTLLPAVWESIADPREFLAILKRKAGLPDDYWSETIRFERYTAISVKA